MLVLLGIGVVVLGFVLRANPLLVVMGAALTTGLAAAWTPDADTQTIYAALTGTLAAFGKAFNDSRYVSIVWSCCWRSACLNARGCRIARAC